MASVNPGNLNSIMQMLNISSSALVQRLFVSPSLVSRWKAGTREIRDDNDYFKEIVDYFIEINESQNEERLEYFLIHNYEPSDDTEKLETVKELVRERLRQYLLQTIVIDADAMTIPQEKEHSLSVSVVKGVESRIEVLSSFFETIMSLNPKPDIYIMEVLYASWCPSYYGWIDTLHKYCLKYMNAGGKIYYFSNLHNFERSAFYNSWQFTSHKNLYPGYSINMAEESPGCAYYLASGVQSVVFYAPEESIKTYTTTIYSDPLILESQEKYLKNKYNQRQKQIFIKTFENRNLLLYYTEQFSDTLNPLLFAGNQPSFLLLSRNSLRKLLEGNNVNDKALRLCLDLHKKFQEQIQNTGISKTFFYYTEDLLTFSVSTDVIDYELTGIVGSPIHYSSEIQKELIANLRSICADPTCRVHIISKENNEVYDRLEESRTLWVKRNSWYMIFYPEGRDRTDLRMITDPLACTLRYDLYHSTLLNVPCNNIETASILSQILYVISNTSEEE